MSKPNTILFVDDEPNILDAIERALFNTPHKILKATGAREGMIVLQEEEVDIVVSDLQMPGMGGVDFLRVVRSRWPDIVRIILTGNDTDKTIMDAIHSNDIFRYLVKPWSPETLSEVIELAVEEWELAQMAMKGDKRHRPVFTLKMIAQLKEQLIEEGLVGREELTLAQEIAHSAGESLGRTMVRLNYAKEAELLDFVTRHMEIPRAKMAELYIDPETINFLPGDVARRYRIIPLFKWGKRLAVAIADPADLMISEEIQVFYGIEIEPVICSEKEIEVALMRYYGSGKD